MYLEYHELLKKYKDAERDYYNALDKKSKLLYLVTPHGTEIKEIVNHLSNNSSDSLFIKYADERKEIDELINLTKNNKNVLEYDLKKKKIELKQSNDPYDKIYFYCWLNHKKPSQIYRLIPCSRSSAYNYKDEVKEKIRELEKKLQKK